MGHFTKVRTTSPPAPSRLLSQQCISCPHVPSKRRRSIWFGQSKITPWAVEWPTSPGRKRTRKMRVGNSLAVQPLGLCASTAGGTGSISGRGTKILQDPHDVAKKKRKMGVKKGMVCDGWTGCGAGNQPSPTLSSPICQVETILSTSPSEMRKYRKQHSRYYDCVTVIQIACMSIKY